MFKNNFLLIAAVPSDELPEETAETAYVTVFTAAVVP